jgi:DNA-binding transcriptional ArsR family regulator
MVAKNRTKKECCSDPLNLPDELEVALQKYGGLDGLKQIVPDRESLESDGIVFNALSDPIRLQILHALDFVDLCPCVLKEITGLSDSKLSYHLNVLENAKLIGSGPQRKWRMYVITDLGRINLGRKAGSSRL